MDFGRTIRHLSKPHHAVRRAFPASALKAIEETTRKSETRHSGQIRFAVESALDVHSLLHGVSAVPAPARCLRICASGIPKRTTAC